MTVVITYLPDDNARNRRRARRQAKREQAMQEQRLARKIALKLSGCVRADKAAWICPYISRHLLSLNPLLACCRRYSRGER